MRENKRTYEFIFLFTGLLIGFLLFSVSHLVFPTWFHEVKVVEAKPAWRPKSIQSDLPPGVEGAKIKYGYLLITKTSEHIGPLVNDPNMIYSGNNLTCNNCHLNAGRKIGSGSFVGIYDRFPQFRGRENRMGTLKDRINGCMERSMNGKVLPEDSEEMEAMIAYMKWLSEDVPDDIEKQYKGYVSIRIPEYKADPVRGKELYNLHCNHCHQDKGQGMKIPGVKFTGYIYPPIGGLDTFNDGAGMNRVLTAAQFIKGNMPFGATYDAPLVSDDEAYHIAAYINTFDRPTKTNRELDFPDKKLKPVSTPYGPWADEFTAEQHKFGPFPPIIDYYKREYDLTKTK